MSWLQKLYETYDRCAGQEQFENRPLMPVSHTEQQVHVEIVIDSEGHFLRAAPVTKETTVIPATESSAGRTSGPVPHPLSDKIQYCGMDYEAFGGKKESLCALYLEQLREWMKKEPSPKVQAVLTYIERGTLVRDLVAAGVLYIDGYGKLLTEWTADGEVPAIFKALTAKAGKRDQGDAFVRWQVEMPDELRYPLWGNAEVQQSWIRFIDGQEKQAGFCMLTGQNTAIATSHPKRIRHGADGAKLISSNDENGFTFRGRFEVASEAYGLGSAVTQKAHNALRWLIARQGVKQGDQVIVSWAVGGQPTPKIAVSTEDLLLLGEGQILNPDADTTPAPYEGDAGQGFSARLNKLLRGYSTRLGGHDEIVVMALDSATPGRMAILYYRELRGSEFLERVQTWHEKMAWPQDFGRDHRFVGAPAPSDIAEVAYGRRVDEKLRKATVERLLPCIVDARPIPPDLLNSAVQRACNRAGLEHWEWERCLGVACALVRGSKQEEQYTMSLDESRTTRSLTV